MAYNALSGTVLAAQEYTPGDLIIGNIVSGNLSTSDGSSIINVPRVSNVTNNAVITNVSGDANNLTCESNLTFDGSVLSVTGEITSSLGVSASYFMGDGSRLTGITAGGGGSGGGIFTEVNGTTAYTTSSVNIGSSATPSHPLAVIGIAQLSGGLVHQRTYKTQDYTITTGDYYIGVNTGAGAVTLTLPAAAAALDGQTWVVKDEGGAAHSNNIIVTGAHGTNTIEGTNQIVLESPYASVHVYCNGATKFFVY